jgi:hypothetical protein
VSDRELHRDCGGLHGGVTESARGGGQKFDHASDHKSDYERDDEYDRNSVTKLKRAIDRDLGL